MSESYPDLPDNSGENMPEKSGSDLNNFKYHIYFQSIKFSAFFVVYYPELVFRFLTKIVKDSI